MNTQNTIRAWKDADFRESLNEAELMAMPANPAGLNELNDSDLDVANGGTISSVVVLTTLIYISYKKCGGEG